MPEINEIEAAARDAKRVRDAADANKAKDDHWPVVPIALGVGSAALAAALLYARNRKK